MTQYPAGGPRQPVYDLMAKLGFSMAPFGDKTWNSADGVTVQLYGAGSMARISTATDDRQYECVLDELDTMLAAIRRRAA